jgi:DNA-binding GntR family transcriptional regulator
VAAARETSAPGPSSKKERGMSLTRQAFERIRDAIVSGDVEFGAHLSETQIATSLGMSKAPVRAAFMELKDKGLVTIVPQSGTYVISPTSEDVRTMSHFRALLEDDALTEALKLHPAALLAKLDEATGGMKRAMSSKDWGIYRKADSAFHLAFLEESGNPYLLRAYHLSATVLEALRVRQQSGGNVRKQSFGEHIDIARMLRTGDVEGARKLLRFHIMVINDSLETLPRAVSDGLRK